MRVRLTIWNHVAVTPYPQLYKQLSYWKTNFPTFDLGKLRLGVGTAYPSLRELSFTSISHFLSSRGSALSLLFSDPPRQSTLLALPPHTGQLSSTLSVETLFNRAVSLKPTQPPFAVSSHSDTHSLLLWCDFTSPPYFLLWSSNYPPPHALWLSPPFLRQVLYNLDSCLLSVDTHIPEPRSLLPSTKAALSYSCEWGDCNTAWYNLTVLFLKTALNSKIQIIRKHPHTHPHTHICILFYLQSWEPLPLPPFFFVRTDLLTHTAHIISLFLAVSYGGSWTGIVKSGYMHSADSTFLTRGLDE